MSSFKVVCKTCASENVECVPKQYSNGTLHIRAKCRMCSTQDNLAHNELPSDFKMPFGKHIGKALTEIVRTDRAYAEWIINDSSFKPNLKDKFLEALSQSQLSESTNF